jgi:hypothetical protein
VGVFCFAAAGRVTLRNLELRADALNEFNLPLTVRAGFLGDLTLDIPFSSLGSQPVRATIDRVYLVTGTKLDYKVQSASTFFQRHCRYR